MLNGSKTFNEFLNQLNFPNEEKGGLSLLEIY